DGWCNGAENCVSCPRDCGGCYPTATPRPWDAAEEITYRCTPWDDCPSGWADVTVLYHRVNNSFIVVDVNCSAESECVLPTPAPQPTQPPQNLWPCNIPPVVESGMIRQPCDEWEGWYLQVEARIPPAGILRNPWPRGMVSIENCLWYEGAQDVEAFSAEKALPCESVNYNRTYDNSVYDCGGETGQVTEDAQVNHQVGAAWRQWRMGDDPVFGYTPMHEVTWVVEDREWNGGDTMYVGNEMCHIYQTSSWGLPADGPTWNPECQDRTCDCDERVADYLGTESYHVKVETWWWPEYT
ncbi:MAG: hypothetical protein GY851_22455, partial [bacterium]|nr:hypothetical protein [bacterium]